MRNFIAAIVAGLALQVCTSTNVMDAEHQLHELKHSTNKKVEEALIEHKKISNELNEIAIATKQRGLEDIQKKTKQFEQKLGADKSVDYKCRGARANLYEELKRSHSDELIRCVEQQGIQGVSTVSTQTVALVASVQNAIYEEEKHIVVCGRRSECLGAVVGDIKNKNYEGIQLINDELQISRHNRNLKVEAIKGCASITIANLEHALEKVPTCIF